MNGRIPGFKYNPRTHSARFSLYVPNSGGKFRRTQTVHAQSRAEAVRAFLRAKRLAEITRRFRFHDLRHSAACTLASMGVSLQVIQKILGHTSIEMTERYVRMNDAASPANLYRLIADIENAPTWRNDLQRVELLAASNGHVHFREHGKNGAVTYEVMHADPPHTRITRIVDQNLGYSGSWTYTLRRRTAARN